MSNRPGFLSVTGAMAAAAAVSLLLVWMLFGGLTPFSPGGLNGVAQARTLGGVTSHARLAGRCEACHTAPWSPQTMADRCVACHGDVATQMQTHSGLHASMNGGVFRTCSSCHSEHGGPNGSLYANFDHSTAVFKLTGKHAGVSCTRCHRDLGSVQGLQGTPRDCFACHAKDDHHNGSFGRQCGQCHTPNGWTGATFDHTIFPVNHGGNAQAACTTCHPNGTGTYTCYGCHEHTPANVASEHRGQNIPNIADCIRCHAGGRGGD